MPAVLAVLLATLLLSGCGTQAIVVSEAAITDDPDKRVVGWTADEAPRLEFSPEDEEVTLRALFEFNYRGVYEWYKVEWIAPDGSPYKVVSLRTDFGSHRDIKASLKIRGKMASRMPGVWRARLWLLGREGGPDRLLVSRLFRITEPTEAQRLAGLTPVDPPEAGAPRPLAQTTASPAAVSPVAPPVPGPAPDPVVSGAAPVPDVSTDKMPRPETGEHEPRAPDADPLPGFPVLPPLAIMLPERADAVQAPAPDKSGTTQASPEPDPAASSAGAGPAAESPEPAPATSSVKVLTGAPWLPPISPSRESTAGSPAPASIVRSYDGCPPMYYPPGPGCIEQAPEE